MRTPEASVVAAGVAGQVALLGLSGRTLTIRSSDVIAVEEGVPNTRDPVYTGARSKIFWNAGSAIIRDTAANVLTAINAAASPAVDRIFKFGKALDCDSGVATDVWDGADGVTSTDIWVPPTVARTHDLVSSSANDAAAGTGLRTVQVFGLTSFSTDEVSEIVTMNGVSNVATANSYVIIHRMIGLTWGATGSNEGIVTATAQTDATITAGIQIGNNQTLMAIFGVPSTQVLGVTGEDVSILSGGPAANADMALLVNETPDVSPSGGFVIKNAYRAATDDPWNQIHDPAILIPGPAIIKMQVVSDTNNTQVTACFNAVLRAA